MERRGALKAQATWQAGLNSSNKPQLAEDKYYSGQMFCKMGVFHSERAQSDLSFFTEMPGLEPLDGSTATEIRGLVNQARAEIIQLKELFRFRHQTILATSKRKTRKQTNKTY